MSTTGDKTNSGDVASFDPYHKWLGIPKEERPPHYYQLLGIPLYESDADVIDSAASQRMTYVRQCATGPHAGASQQVLNDLSEAQICLLNAEKKADYDARLKVKLRESSTTSAPAAAGTDAKLQQRLQTLDKQKKQAETLLKKNEYAAAIDILEKMAAVKSPKLARYAKWAKQKLPAARRGPKEMQESTAAILRTAQGMFDRNEFEEAAEILQQIPRKFRGREAEVLLRECLDIQEEIVVLQEDIDHAESLKKYEDLLPTVERLLELKPNDRRAKQLRKELKTYGKGGGMRLGGRGDTRFDAAGNTSSPIKTALLVLVPLAAFGAVSWYAYNYLSSLQQTIQIEIDDPTATVLIDDKAIEVTGAGDSTKLNPGLHQLRVERDGDVLLTRQFEVVKGKNPVLAISVANAAGPSTPGSTLAGNENEPRVFTGHTGPAYAVVMSADGRRMVSSGHDGTARLWDVATGEEIRQFKVSEGGIVFSVALSPDGKRIVSSGTGNQDPPNTVQLWDAETGDELQRFEGHAKGVQAVAYSPDGKMCASGSIGSIVRNWDCATGAQVGQDIQAGGGVTALHYSNDSTQILVGHSGRVVVYDVQTGAEVRKIDGFVGVTLSLALSRDGQRLLTGSGVGTVGLWNFQSGEEIRQFVGHIDLIGGADFSPDENHIVSGSFDGTVRVWETDTGKEVAKFERKDAKHQVRGMTVSPDGRFAATAGLDAQVRLWPLPAAVGGGTSPSASPPEAPIDYSKTVREAAEWVLSVGGKVGVGGQTITEPAQLPPGDFTVTFVNLSHCNISDRHIPHVLPLKTITHLNLISTGVSDGSIRIMLQLPEVHEFYIDGAKVSLDGLADLAKKPQLTKLYAYGIGLTDDGLTEIAKLKNLGILNVAGNPITDRGMRNFPLLPKLRELQIQKTDVTDDSLSELKQCPNLRMLYLGSPKITDNGVKNLTELTALRSLRFYGASNLSDGCVNDLVKMKDLTDLWLVGTAVTDAGVNRLKAAIPNAVIEHRK